MSTNSSYIVEICYCILIYIYHVLSISIYTHYCQYDSPGMQSIYINDSRLIGMFEYIYMSYYSINIFILHTRYIYNLYGRMGTVPSLAHIYMLILRVNLHHTVINKLEIYIRSYLYGYIMYVLGCYHPQKELMQQVGIEPTLTYVAAYKTTA